MTQLETASFQVLQNGTARCLVIPEGLPDFADATAIMVHGQGAIFHKLIRQSAFDVEFFNSVACLCFVRQGTETFLTPGGAEIVVGPGEMLMMPRNVHMISNFSNAQGPLEAYLCFFDQAVIGEFTRKTQTTKAPGGTPSGSYKIAAHDSLRAYMDALGRVYRPLDTSPALLRTKLIELLHLIRTVDCPDRQAAFLHDNNADSGKRNIRFLMRQHAGHNLGVADYARLSGRSVSAFNRDFKRQFGMSPRQWLIEQRLVRARAAVLTSGAPVSEIAASVGYDSPSHFIAQFRKRFGTTPNRMRQQNL